MMQSIQNTTPGKKQSPDELRASHQVSKPRDSSRAAPRRGNVPMTFFMRSEEDMEKSYESAPSSEVDDSTYGVRSIDSEVGLSEQETLADVHREGSPSRIPGASLTESIPRAKSPFLPILARSPLSERSTTSTSTSSSPSRHASRLTRPLTPLLLRSPNANSTTDSAPLSTPRSVSLRSLRLSDDEYSVDEAASQVLTSSGEDEDELNEDTVLAGHDADAVEAGRAPQLVMPSIKMPIRRPFTERGKSIGKLKIMIVGSKGKSDATLKELTRLTHARGSGKSALIKSIVQTCDDIVHVDSITSSSSVSMSRSNTQTSSSSRHDAGKTTMNEITEIAASTRAYPKWWTEIDDSQILRRRRRSSMNETVLERNISFIDTPGIDANAADQASKKALQHVEGLLWRNQSFASFSDGEILSVFSGNGGMQVDVVLFLLRGQCNDIFRMIQANHYQTFHHQLSWTSSGGLPNSPVFFPSSVMLIWSILMQSQNSSSRSSQLLQKQRSVHSCSAIHFLSSLRRNLLNSHRTRPYLMRFPHHPPPTLIRWTPRC
jgi:hypothetical protein